MKIPPLLICAMIVSSSASSFALAETGDAGKPAKMSDEAIAARDKKCSLEADAKGLFKSLGKGEERRKFREDCKKRN
jgi:hypothetical protein